ncbi:hypothetical protein Cgig2_006022 [Carnegiea gigantea]|uniref:AMP-dependent synthetase/ligase domain-containing protein n=1 Tax=Carnegiea gigantea TaxID=171969 RepID=A0A9Q1QRV0_9CARY|nr:hypothetical protein Cgig2_006022 [Carnegiea gigantea]
MSHKTLDCITVSDIEAQGIPSETAEKTHQKLAQIIRNHGSSSPQTWQCISKQLLNPDLPFSLHQMLYYGCYKDFGPDPPAWLPDLESARLTNIGQLLERRGKEFLGPRYKDLMSSFSEFQEFSVSKPEVYWNSIFEEMGILFATPHCILRETSSYPGGQWLPGCLLNPAKSCLTLNARRNLDDIVIVWRDEGEDDMPIEKMTLQELRTEVWSVAHALSALGLPSGSAIAIDMPMNVNSVVIYLAIVLSGNIVVSIADSFAPTEIATRLRIAKAKAIFTQDTIFRGGKSIPLYRRVIDAQSPVAIVIPTRGTDFSVKLRSGDISWHDFRGTVKKIEEYKAVDQPTEAFTNILFSSGTTGEPKAIPWTHATPLKAAADAWCHMDIRKGDVVAWPTNLGWMMGPWLVYASLLNNASIALYNGSPLGSGFAKFVQFILSVSAQDAKVTMLGVVPSIVRAWKSTNCPSGYDWSAIRYQIIPELDLVFDFSPLASCFGSTGEASNVDEYLWLMGRACYKPVIEYCGGTEIGGGFITGSFLQPQVLAAFSTPAMGCRLFILDNNGAALPQNKPCFGELALWPLMFGASQTLLNGDHYKVYFEGMPTWNGKVLRRHGDVFERTSSGYYRAHGRADDTMNLGGIKVSKALTAYCYTTKQVEDNVVSSVEIERICNGVHSSILETAAIGVPPSGGGPEQLVSRVVSLPSLPRTATNKVMRRVLRQQLAEGDSASKL